MIHAMMKYIQWLILFLLNYFLKLWFKKIQPKTNNYLLVIKSLEVAVLK